MWEPEDIKVNSKRKNNVGGHRDTKTGDTVRLPTRYPGYWDMGTKKVKKCTVRKKIFRTEQFQQSACRGHPSLVSLGGQFTDI
jgi:hypothetical protein